MLCHGMVSAGAMRFRFLRRAWRFDPIRFTSAAHPIRFDLMRGAVWRGAADSVRLSARPLPTQLYSLGKAWRGRFNAFRRATRVTRPIRFDSARGAAEPIRFDSQRGAAQPMRFDSIPKT